MRWAWRPGSLYLQRDVANSANKRCAHQKEVGSRGRSSRMDSESCPDLPEARSALPMRVHRPLRSQSTPHPFPSLCLCGGEQAGVYLTASQVFDFQTTLAIMWVLFIMMESFCVYYQNILSWKCQTYIPYVLSLRYSSYWDFSNLFHHLSGFH